MMAPIVGVLGVVLAGGASRRMGRDKAALTIGGEPLLRRVVSRLRLALADVAVVGDPAWQGLVPETRVLADAWPGRGPLGALATALQGSDAPWALLVACDMPFPQPPLLREMARLALASSDAGADAEAVALRGPRGLEPLHTAYARACLPLALERLAGADASLQGLLAALRVCEVPAAVAQRLDPRNLSAFNANTPDDWQRALRLADAE